jgi:hypothetical protein
VTFVGGDQARDVRKIAHELRLHAEFDLAGPFARPHGAPSHTAASGPSRGQRANRAAAERRKLASARPRRRSGRR